jgi:RHS repeat-associated protein
MREENGRLASITTDHLGTPTEMYDEMGAPIWKARLDLFGVCTIERGTRAQCPFRWPGQYEDEETGLYYNRFRYYDPSEGVYVSQDPIRLAGGLALYGYVADPLLCVDVFGLTGTYVFEFASGEMYVGKGPIQRARASQRGRSTRVGTSDGSRKSAAHRSGKSAAPSRKERA